MPVIRFDFSWLSGGPTNPFILCKTHSLLPVFSELSQNWEFGLHVLGISSVGRRGGGGAGSTEVRDGV